MLLFIKQVCEKLALVPGKLDHATVVAYTVGCYREEDGDNNDDNLIRRPVFRAAPLASPDSTRSLVSQLEGARPLDPPAASTTSSANFTHSHTNGSGSPKRTSQGSADGKRGERGSPRHNYSQNKENLSPNTSQVQCRSTLIETIV